MQDTQKVILTFSASTQMADVLVKVLKIKSRKKGKIIQLSGYIRELIIADIKRNYLKKPGNVGKAEA